MPSSDARLQEKFMQHDEHGQCVDDGCAACERVIRDAGGSVSKGVIKVAGVLEGELLDAVNFLVWEWDYAYEPI